MKLWRKAALVIGLAAVMTAFFASAAMATVTIYEGRGVAKARLGLTDKHNKPLLGKVLGSWKETYPTYTNYYYGFGKKLHTHVYALLMVAKNHRTIEFVCLTRTYVTTKGIKVGSTKAQLVSKYKGLKRHTSGPNWRYTYHYKAYTDFYVRKSTGKVVEIVVWSF